MYLYAGILKNSRIDMTVTPRMGRSQQGDSCLQTS
jgi:hypothetical protein